MENETDEQFEERVLNKRAAQMFVSVRARLQKQDGIQLSDMTYRNNRKQVKIVIQLIGNSLMKSANRMISYKFFLNISFLGGAKVLFTVGIEEVSSA